MDMCRHMYIDIRNGMCTDLCTDMCTGICLDMCIDMYKLTMDLCTDRCIGRCTGTRIDRCIVMYTDMHSSAMEACAILVLAVITTTPCWADD